MPLHAAAQCAVPPARCRDPADIALDALRAFVAGVSVPIAPDCTRLRAFAVSAIVVVTRRLLPPLRFARRMVNSHGTTRFLTTGPGPAERRTRTQRR